MLGIDPGLQTTGFAVVDVCGNVSTPVWHGCVTTRPSEGLAGRLGRIAGACLEVIENLSPRVCAIEDMFFGIDAKAAMALGHVRGACIQVCNREGLDVYSYEPARVKQAVTGYGRADKAQVQAMVQRILGLPDPPSPDHAADAYACAICHAGVARTF